MQGAWARKALWAFSGMDMAFIGTDMASGASTTPMPGVMPEVMPGDAAGKGTIIGLGSAWLQANAGGVFGDRPASDFRRRDLSGG